MCWRRRYTGMPCIHTLIVAVDQLSFKALYRVNTVNNAVVALCHQNWLVTTYCHLSTVHGVDTTYEEDVDTFASKSTRNPISGLTVKLGRRLVMATTYLPLAQCQALTWLAELRSVCRQGLSGTEFACAVSTFIQFFQPDHYGPNVPTAMTCEPQALLQKLRTLLQSDTTSTPRMLPCVPLGVNGVGTPPITELVPVVRTAEPAAKRVAVTAPVVRTAEPVADPNGIGVPMNTNDNIGTYLRHMAPVPPQVLRTGVVAGPFANVLRRGELPTGRRCKQNMSGTGRRGKRRPNRGSVADPALNHSLQETGVVLRIFLSLGDFPEGTREPIVVTSDAGVKAPAALLLSRLQRPITGTGPLSLASLDIEWVVGLYRPATLQICVEGARPVIFHLALLSCTPEGVTDPRHTTLRGGVTTRSLSLCGKDRVVLDALHSIQSGNPSDILTWTKSAAGTRSKAKYKVKRLGIASVYTSVKSLIRDGR